MIRARAVVFAFLLVTMLSMESMGKQHEGMTPEAERKAAELFPEATGVFSLQEKVSARLAHQGVKLINYEVMLEGKDVGEVTRIVSLMEEGLAANLDMLVRYDDKGVVQGIVSLKPWKEVAGAEDLTRLLWSLKGQDLRESNACSSPSP